MCQELDSDFFILLKLNKEKAFQLVFDIYWHPLYKQAFKKVQRADLAKDLVQDVFVCLWDKIDMLDSEQSVLAYCYAILRNKILQLYEKNKVQLRYAISVAGNEIVADQHSQNVLLEKELTAIINEEIERMPPRMREIYILKKEDELSIKEIAEDLSISEQTIKNQLQMAYQRLRNRLKNYDSSLAILSIILSKLL
ncbi:sigma-70 family RNA polymerase sigma factor [Pedobacter sp. KR3-3]|uniref:Sigma-70 family RNA polymerase sigma factor n=1 Tax=Pedobacter albus TaxID=3113905 RepID=A0ABU7I450_9SPHI|nr:sigma-70 family RNA polymerase sigma factor [Pedobacter sp. KR3-3]MEE1944230.1 sigma-70 family RNA polymerase sigma factor [Pedobacter sp. KR3-3]